MIVRSQHNSAAPHQTKQAAEVVLVLRQDSPDVCSDSHLPNALLLCVGGVGELAHSLRAVLQRLRQRQRASQVGPMRQHPHPEGRAGQQRRAAATGLEHCYRKLHAKM